MLKTFFVLLLLFLMPLSGIAEHDYCLENDLIGKLNNLANAISHSAYIRVEAQQNSMQQQALQSATERASYHESRLAKLISEIELFEDLQLAEEVVDRFSSESLLARYTGNIALRMIDLRTAAISTADESVMVQPRSTRMQIRPEDLLTESQRQLIKVDIPVVEAAVFFKDNKQQRRLNNFSKMLSRHGCTLISSHIDTSDKDTVHNMYFTGRKYIVDAIISHFGGTIINSDLKAIVKVTTGGFWSGRNTKKFVITPDRQDFIGELEWYKTFVEKDPLNFLLSNDFNQIIELGSLESVGDKEKLLLKNAIVEIWVTPQDKDKVNALYSSKTEFGDQYIAIK